MGALILDTDRERIARLPSWARDLIKRLEYANEPMLDECAKLRRENEQLAKRTRKLNDAKSALVELLSCAGQGGSDWAATVVRTLEEYEIFQKPTVVTQPLNDVSKEEG